MGWLTWWFEDVPKWGWRVVEDHGGLSFGALVLLVLMALVYVLVTLAVLVGAYGVLAWAAQNFKRGYRQGRAKREEP